MTTNKAQIKHFEKTDGRYPTSLNNGAFPAVNGERHLGAVNSTNIMQISTLSVHVDQFQELI